MVVALRMCNLSQLIDFSKQKGFVISLVICITCILLRSQLLTLLTSNLTSPASRTNTTAFPAVSSQQSTLLSFGHLLASILAMFSFFLARLSSEAGKCEEEADEWVCVEDEASVASASGDTS